MLFRLFVTVVRSRAEDASLFCTTAEAEKKRESSIYAGKVRLVFSRRHCNSSSSIQQMSLETVGYIAAASSLFGHTNMFVGLNNSLLYRCTALYKK
jgi:hypothetical protein